MRAADEQTDPQERRDQADLRRTVNRRRPAIGDVLSSRERMNPIKKPTRLAAIAMLLWLAFLTVANGATVWTKADFKPIADGPITTRHARDAGWPLMFVQEIYSRSPAHIALEFDHARVSLNILLIGLVQLALASLVWRMEAIAVRHLLALVTVAAVVMAFAVESANRFGGDVPYYALLYAYIAPVALAGIRLPAQIINWALRALRLRRQNKGVARERAATQFAEV